MAFSTTKNLNIGRKYAQMMNGCTDRPLPTDVASNFERCIGMSRSLLPLGTDKLLITYKSVPGSFCYCFVLNSFPVMTFDDSSNTGIRCSLFRSPLIFFLHSILLIDCRLVQLIWCAKFYLPATTCHNFLSKPTWR